MFRFKLSALVLIGCISCFAQSVLLPAAVGTGAVAGTSIGISKLAGLGTGLGVGRLAGLGTGLGVSKVLNAGLVGGAAGSTIGIGSLIGGSAGASAGSVALGFGLPSVALSAGTAGTATGVGIGISAPSIAGIGLGGLGAGGLGLGLGSLGLGGLGGLGLGGLGLGLGALSALPLLVVGKLALASGIGLAIAAGVLLKKKKEAEEYYEEEDNYYPPATGYENTYSSYPGPSDPAPAYYGGYNTDAYAQTNAYPQTNGYAQTNTYANNGYAQQQQAYRRGRRAIQAHKPKTVNALTPQALMVMEALVVDAANKDKSRCGARLICEMHQKPRETLKTEETVLVDFFKLYITAQPNVDMIESPRDVFVYAASLGRYYPTMKQLCASAFPECPLQDQVLFAAFHNATYSV